MNIIKLKQISLVNYLHEFILSTCFVVLNSLMDFAIDYPTVQNEALKKYIIGKNYRIAQKALTKIVFC